VQDGGELVQLDWSTKKIIRRLPIFPTDPEVVNDPNPRGNSRGGKGIIINQKQLFVGTYHTILVFDHHLNLRGKVTNNLFSNIHEMCFAGENIWASSTTIDCAVLVNQQGDTIKSWWPREEPLLQQKYGLSPMKISKTADNRIKYLHDELEKKESHTHLNSVTKFGEKTYVLLNRLGIVVEIEPVTRVVLESELIRGAHSPVVTENGEKLCLCSSFNKDILLYDLKEARLVKRIHLLNFSEIAALHRNHPDQPYNKSVFVRGLEVIDSDRILVGISPASILEIHTAKDTLIDFYQYSSDVGDAVHGLVHLKRKLLGAEYVS